VTERFVRAQISDRIRLVEGDYRSADIPVNTSWPFSQYHSRREVRKKIGAWMAKLYGSSGKGGRIAVKDHILDDSLKSPRAARSFRF
jgi:hypothetical protein